jgi:hypothetical protein
LFLTVLIATRTSRRRRARRPSSRRTLGISYRPGTTIPPQARCCASGSVAHDSGVGCQRSRPSAKGS